MEIISSIFNVLACPSCGKINLKLSETASMKKGLAHIFYFCNVTVVVILLSFTLQDQRIIHLILIPGLCIA